MTAVDRAQRRSDPPAAAAALQRQLEGLRHVIDSVPAELYRASPSRASGSIGAHVRHCLDHVRVLVSHCAGAAMTYDARLRGTGVETETRDAAAEIDRLCAALADLPPSRLDERIVLRSQTDRDGTAAQVETTMGRELAFVVQHTIHHAAIINVLLDAAGCATPSGFGYAPSTPRRELAAAS
jgi:uncharacterized damage-inducible protein DinB